MKQDDTLWKPNVDSPWLTPFSPILRNGLQTKIRHRADGTSTILTPKENATFSRRFQSYMINPVP